MNKKGTLLICLLLSLGFKGIAWAQPRSDVFPPVTINQPFVVNTFEAPIRVVPIAVGLANPFDMAFRDNGDILVTERFTGNLRVIRNGSLLEESIRGVPQVYSESWRQGLMAVELHPDDDRIVYMTYTKAIMVDGDSEQTVALVRARIVENELTEVEEIFEAEGLDRGIAASQLLFAPDNKLMMSIGGAYMYAGIGDYAQDPTIHYGKLLRLNDDGSVPSDNPFVTSGEYLPEVYTVGHRNQIGLAFHPTTDQLWATENGPQGGDELNRIIREKNYGWPIATFGTNYNEKIWKIDQTNNTHTGFEKPIYSWGSTFGISNLIVYESDYFSKWKKNLLISSLVAESLVRAIFDENKNTIIYYENITIGNRIRDILQSPDGKIVLLTDNLLREKVPELIFLAKAE